MFRQFTSKKIWLSALDKRDFKNVYVKNEHIKEKHM